MRESASELLPGEPVLRSVRVRRTCGSFPFADTLPPCHTGGKPQLTGRALRQGRKTGQLAGLLEIHRPPGASLLPFSTARRLSGLAAGLILGLVLCRTAAFALDGITIFAAASLKNAMDDISAGFRAETGHPAIVSHAGSSALARQIRHGAPADIFLSANPGWMDLLERDRLIDPASRFDLLGNAIVLIAHGRDAAPVEIGPGAG